MKCSAGMVGILFFSIISIAHSESYQVEEIDPSLGPNGITDSMSMLQAISPDGLKVAGLTRGSGDRSFVINLISGQRINLDSNGFTSSIHRINNDAKGALVQGIGAALKSYQSIPGSSAVDELDSIPNSANSIVLGLNSLGKTSGMFFNNTGVIWSANGSVETLIENTKISSINDQGAIVGGTMSGQRRAFYRAAGSTQNELLPFIPAGISETYAYDINNQHVVLAGGLNGTHAFRARKVSRMNNTWNSESLFCPNGSAQSYGAKLNDSKVVVGACPENNDMHAVRWSATSSAGVKLHNLIVGENPFVSLTYATSISNNGVIVGYGRRADGKVRGYILYPIPD